MQTTEQPAKTAVIAAVQIPGVDDEAHATAIAELTRLLKTLGYKVVGTVSQRRPRPRASTILGSGKLLELAAYTGGTGVVPSRAAKAKSHGEPEPEPHDDDDDEAGTDVEADAPAERVDFAAAEAGSDQAAGTGFDPNAKLPHADVIVVDGEITPRQARNLERACDAEVLDRTGVIVEIFYRHAKTREARLQVEIARLTYVVPRLRAGVRGHDRTRGGVGGKGSGESALELDRRKVRDRVAHLRHELERVQRDEQTRRSRRQGLRRVALVGYTNAGKSSLMRALTGSKVLVEDKLFATLGTTVRALFPEITPRILVSDTVGFINRLPHDLVASFRSTLDEALEASILLYIVDASDPAFRTQLKVSREVLAEIGADAVKSRLILNKMDKVDDDQRLALTQEFPDAIQLSAHNPKDVSALRDTLIAFFDGATEEARFFVHHAQGKLAAEVRATTRVVRETHDGRGTHFHITASAAIINRFRDRVTWERR